VTAPDPPGVKSSTFCSLLCRNPSALWTIVCLVVVLTIFGAPLPVDETAAAAAAVVAAIAAAVAASACCLDSYFLKNQKNLIQFHTTLL
jgi:hypothetical protein